MAKFPELIDLLPLSGRPLPHLSLEEAQEYGGHIARLMGICEIDLRLNGWQARQAQLWAARELRQFNIVPHIENSAKISALVTLGYTEIFRGIGALTNPPHDPRGLLIKRGEVFAAEFRGGQFYPSMGILTYGTYTTVSCFEAFTYTNRKHGGEVVRMALRPESLVIEAEDGMEMWLTAFHRHSPSPDSAAYLALSTPESYLTLLGYDALRIAEASKTHYVLFNRGSVHVQAEPVKP